MLWANTPLFHKTVYVDYSFGIKKITEHTAKHLCGPKARGGGEAEGEGTRPLLPEKHKLLPAHPALSAPCCISGLGKPRGQVER